MVRASVRKMKDGTTAFPPQAGPGYEAFWLRDYEYVLEGCGDAISDKELRDACKTFIHAVDKNGAGVDCVKFDGTAIYMPGYGTMGKNPVADGSIFTIEMAWQTQRRLQDKKFLTSIVDKLMLAHQGVPRNRKTGLVHIATAGFDRCPYGFTDSIRKQGDELFCSLLLIEADRHLAEMFASLDRNGEAREYAAEAELLMRTVRETFWDEKSGLFLAASDECRQPDLWGSAFAVYTNVATKEQSQKISRYFKVHYPEIIRNGQMRHLPGGMYWEKASSEKDTYQNGGYWATPIGWFIYTLDLVAPKLADQTLVDMVGDFQKRGVNEWVFGEHVYTANYLASATLPLAGARKVIERRKEIK